MRVFNRLAVLVLGAMLVAAGGLLIVEVVATGLGSGFVWIPGGRWLASAETTSRSSATVVWVSAAVAAGAGLLSVAELRKWRRLLVPVDPDGEQRWWLLRRSAERHLARQVGADVPGSAVRARLDDRPGTWTLRLRVRPPAPAPGPDLRAIGERELVRLGAPAARLVVVKARPPRRAHE